MGMCNSKCTECGSDDQTTTFCSQACAAKFMRLAYISPSLINDIPLYSYREKKWNWFGECVPLQSYSMAP